ncbi:MAG TPA: hypothetical protein VFP95_04145 [Gammaproteobacteria bacterium]|nr:hypothetical protein [Gammaproteobacteria bacterium]
MFDKTMPSPPPITREQLTGNARLREETRWQTASHQSAVHLVEHEGQRYVVKTPHGRGIRHWLTAWLIRREYTIYQHLCDVTGIPPCYGLTPEGWLVLGFVPAHSFRGNPPANRSHYFAELRALLQTLHAHGVAHGDLKNKDNLMIAENSTPFIIDFGIAMRWRPGFHPLNHFLFRLARRLDYSAWAKHKYRGRSETVAEEDKAFMRRGPLERGWHHLRNGIQRLRGRSTSNVWRPKK